MIEKKTMLVDCDGVVLNWEYAFDIFMEEYGFKRVDGAEFIYDIGKRYGVEKSQGKKLIKQLLLKNDTFVHRDFHVSNLMIIKNKIGIIDSQDALFGNKAYDLASLIDDVRFKTSKKMKQKVFYLYLQTQKKLNIKHFNNDFEIISVLRNLKIIGIFTRLALRDKKNKYLKLVPYAWDLIRLRSRNNEKFKSLNKLLMVFKNFKR